MPFICIDCVKDASLKKLVTRYGTDSVVCDLCHRTLKAINAGSNLFQQLFKALIRYHFNEWEYNTHWGGDELESIFHSENPIIEHLKIKDKDGFYSVLEAATANAYEEYDKGVTLFAGYSDDGMPAGILRSIKSEIHPALETIEKRLKTENYFNAESDMQAIIEPYKGVIDTTIPEGFEFLRARVGFKGKELPSDSSFQIEYNYEPFSGPDISAPPPSLASAGRINRQGISFFYAATDPRTAIAEIRPHPGDIVSVGRFKAKKQLLVADFTETRIEHFSGSDQLLNDFLTIHSINVYLNKVVPPSERNHYSVTQLIADILRQLGYDGVLFLSTVEKGHNIVLFYPEFMEYKPGEGKVFEIQKLTYVIREKMISNDGLR